jgi:hypothetical protein
MPEPDFVVSRHWGTLRLVPFKLQDDPVSGAAHPAPGNLRNIVTAPLFRCFESDDRQLT